jgi:hypothetical protein
VKWLRLAIGPQPVLRLIALLLSAIAILLFLLLRAVEDIERQMPYPQEICGSDYDPCRVKITSG